jgi:hypothetical protein
MLDIHGQPNQAVGVGVGVAVTPIQVVSPPTQPKPLPAVPSVTSDGLAAVRWGAIALLVLVAASGGTVSFVRAQTTGQLATVQREVDDLTTQLGQPQNVRLEALVAQLTAGSTLVTAQLAIGPIWTAFLKNLTDRTPSEISYTNLSVDEQWHVRVTGVASSYPALAQYLAGLTAPSSQFSDVVLESTTSTTAVEAAAVTFSVKATYVPPPGTGNQTNREGNRGGQ